MTFPADILDAGDTELVGRCLRAAASGPFFPDWEFQTLIGADRDRVQALADAWPNVDLSEPEPMDAIQSVLANLLGYPHGEEEAWRRLISVPPATVQRVLETLASRT